MARSSAIQAAKRRFLEEVGERPWLMAIGIGKVDETTGLIISVKPGAQSTAARMVNQLGLRVPVAIRGVEKIRARSPKGHRKTAADRLAALREAALRRSR